MMKIQSTIIYVFNLIEKLLTRNELSVVILDLTKTIIFGNLVGMHNVYHFVCFHFSFMAVCHCCMCFMGLYGSLYLPASGEIYSEYRY